MELSKLEPKTLFKFFLELSAIPRGSGNERAAGDYALAFARGRGLEACRDEALNVIIKKPGTPGYELADRVILQGHLDMVCEKNADSDHDFFKDGIKVYIDGDFLKADGTTLGADNGVAVAMALSILDADDIPHPPLTVLLTTNEEVGLLGASQLSGEHLDGRYMLNLDAAGEGVITVGCAGGLRVTLTLPAERVAVPLGYRALNINVSGLQGGHSGSDINKGRANANQLMGRVLTSLANHYNLYIADINGGDKENAIPRESAAVVYVHANDVEAALSGIEQIASNVKNEYSISDPHISITAKQEETSSRSSVYSHETEAAIIAALSLLPNGILGMNPAFPHIVETSANLGVVRSAEDGVSFLLSLRSSLASKKYALLNQISAFSALTGAKLTTFGDYPSWAYKKDSPLQEACNKTYKSLFGSEPKFDLIHAGLECGILSEKAPHLDIVAFGPDIFDLHSPDERLSIPSTGRVWTFLLELLKKLK